MLGPEENSAKGVKWENISYAQSAYVRIYIGILLLTAIRVIVHKFRMKKISNKPEENIKWKV